MLVSHGGLRWRMAQEFIRPTFQGPVSERRRKSLSPLATIVLLVTAVIPVGGIKPFRRTALE